MAARKSSASSSSSFSVDRPRPFFQASSPSVDRNRPKLQDRLAVYEDAEKYIGHRRSRAPPEGAFEGRQPSVPADHLRFRGLLPSHLAAGSRPVPHLELLNALQEVSYLRRYATTPPSKTASRDAGFKNLILTIVVSVLPLGET